MHMNIRKLFAQHDVGNIAVNVVEWVRTNSNDSDNDFTVVASHDVIKDFASGNLTTYF